MSNTAKNTNESQPDTEHVKKEIKGIIFLLVALILGVSLFTYSSDDYVFYLNTYKGNAHNLFGVFGSHLSGYLFYILGSSSFWLIVIFFIMAILSFQGRKLLPPLKSITAILFLLVSFSGIMSLQLHEETLNRVGEILSGGLVGYYTSIPLKGLMNPFGANVFLLAIFIISFMICTHISLGRFFSKIFIWISILIRRLREYNTKRMEKRRKQRVRMILS